MYTYYFEVRHAVGTEVQEQGKIYLKSVIMKPVQLCLKTTQNSIDDENWLLHSVTLGNNHQPINILCKVILAVPGHTSKLRKSCLIELAEHNNLRFSFVVNCCYVTANLVLLPLLY